MHLQTCRTETSSVPSLHLFLCPLSSRPLCGSALNPKFERDRHVNVFREDTMVDQYLNYHFVSFCCEIPGEFRNIPLFFYSEGKVIQ